MIVVALGSFVSFVTQKTDTAVSLEAGDSLCGKVLRVDASRVVVRLRDSGRIRVIPLTETKTIKDNAC